MFFLATGVVTWGFHVGMEIGMMVFLVLLTVLWLQEDIASGRIGRSAFALSLLAMARPEGMLFGIASAGMLLVVCRKEKIQRNWLLLLPFAAAVAYVSVNYWIGGNLMPNSGRPKSPFFTPYFSFLFVLQHSANFLLFVVKGLLFGTLTTNVLAPENRIDDMTFFPPLSIVLFLTGALYCAVREWKVKKAGAGVLLSMWFVLGLLFVSVASGKGHHNFRYLLPFLAVYSIFIIPGGWVLWASIAGGPTILPARAIRIAGVLVLVGFQLLTTVNFLLIFGQNAYGFLPTRKSECGQARTFHPITGSQRWMWDSSRITASCQFMISSDW